MMKVKRVPGEGLTIFATQEISVLKKLDQDQRSYFILLAIVGIALILLAGLVVYLIAMRLTNARVAASELRYRTLFESSRDAITTLSPGEHRFLSGNSAAIAMFKTGDEALFSTKSPWDLSPEFQPDGRSSKETAKQQIETTVREGVLSFEWMHKRLDGELFPASVLLTSFQINGQTIIQSTVRDITERKKAEDRLVKDAQEMENINRQLLENQSRLIQSEKLAAIGQLAAGVAHEINNPVGFVTSNSAMLVTYVHAIKEIVRMADEGKTPAEIAAKKKVLKIDFILGDIDSLLLENQDGLSRIMDIVKNLKTFARREKDNVYIEADLNAGINSALVIARNEIKYHADVKLELGNISMIFCRIGEINQVVLNLLVNAAQSIAGQDRKGMEQGLITIRTYERDGFVYCEIQDNGPGIPLEIQKRMFEPFFTTKENGKGTGLGLSISQDIIVKKHHGDLSFRSEPGKGCTFFIRLPIDGRNLAITPEV